MIRTTPRRVCWQQGLLSYIFRTLHYILAAGISLRSLELYLLVFVCRYLDLFTSYYGFYNTTLKVYFVATTAWAIWLMRRSSSSSSMETMAYDPEQDAVQHWRYVAAPVAILALLTSGSPLQGDDSYPMKLLWTFSIQLEAVAMLPQLILVWRHRRVERLAGFYILGMGLYRMFYILNWIYRAHTEPYYRHHYIVYICGVVQSLLYADFFFYAITKRERPLVAWRRRFANVTSAGEPLLQDESSRDDEDTTLTSETGFLLLGSSNEQHDNANFTQEGGQDDAVVNVVV